MTLMTVVAGSLVCHVLSCVIFCAASLNTKPDRVYPLGTTRVPTSSVKVWGLTRCDFLWKHYAVSFRGRKFTRREKKYGMFFRNSVLESSG